MSDPEIEAVATAICHAHRKDGSGDWRAYKELAISIIAGSDALAGLRKGVKEKAITKAVEAIAAAPEPKEGQQTETPLSGTDEPPANDTASNVTQIKPKTKGKK